MKPGAVVEMIEKTLVSGSRCVKRKFELKPILIPVGNSHGQNSDVAARSTVCSRRQLLNPLFRFTCNEIVNAHCPAMRLEDKNRDEVIASALYSQMNRGMRKSFMELKPLKRVMIRNSTRMAKDMERERQVSVRETMNDDPFKREFSTDLRKANVSREAMRSIRRTLRKRFGLRLTSERKLTDAHIRAKIACCRETGLRPTRDGYRISLRTLVELEVTRFLATIKETQKGKGNIISEVNEEFRRRLQNEWLIKLTLDSRRVTTKHNHTEIMMMLLPTNGDNVEDCIRRCQSPVEYRTVALWEGNDHKGNIQANMVEIFEEIRDLEKHGILCKVKDDNSFTIRGVLNKEDGISSSSDSRSDSESDSEQEGESAKKRRDLSNRLKVWKMPTKADKPNSGWRHCDENELNANKLTKMGIKFAFAADMAALAGVYGHGCSGGNHFCIDCNIHKNQRNIPYELFKTKEPTTVGALASRFNSRPSLLAALNSEKCREGLYHNFKDRHLQVQTAGFEGETCGNTNQSNESESIQSNVNSTPSGQFGGKRPGKREPQENHHTIAAKKQRANQSSSTSKIQTLSDILHTQTTWHEISLKAIAVPAGTLVRVPRVHQSSRNSDWLAKHWPEYKGRTFLCCLHCLMRVTESLFLVISDLAQNGKLVDQLNEGLALVGLENKSLRLAGTCNKYYEKISFLGIEAKKLLEIDESGKMKIETVLRHVWPNGEARRDTSSEVIKSFVTDTIEIWRKWSLVVRMLQEKDPRKVVLDEFTNECTEFVCLFQSQFHGDYCKAYYLHTLLSHAGESMKNALELGVTLGCLANDGAERRHEYGRRYAKKSFWGGRWREKYPDSQTLTNISCYICILEILVGENQLEEKGVKEEEEIIDHIDLADQTTKGRDSSDEELSQIPDWDSMLYDEAIQECQGKDSYFPDNDTLLFRPTRVQTGEVEYGSEDVSDEDEEPFLDKEKGWTLNWLNDHDFEFADTTSDPDFYLSGSDFLEVSSD